jgi:hypothetical protein
MIKLSKTTASVFHCRITAQDAIELSKAVKTAEDTTMTDMSTRDFLMYAVRTINKAAK